MNADVTLGMEPLLIVIGAMIYLFAIGGAILAGLFLDQKRRLQSPCEAPFKWGSIFGCLSIILGILEIARYAYVAFWVSTSSTAIVSTLTCLLILQILLGFAIVLNRSLWTFLLANALPWNWIFIPINWIYVTKRWHAFR